MEQRLDCGKVASIIVFNVPVTHKYNVLIIKSILEDFRFKFNLDRHHNVLVVVKDITLCCKLEGIEQLC